MPHLEDYELKIVTVQAPQENRFQFTDAELKKLLDPEDQGVLRREPGQPERDGASRRRRSRRSARS